MSDAFRRVWASPWVRVLVVLALAVLALLFVIRTRGVWFVVVAAFLLAYLLYPLMAWSQRTFHRRWIGALAFFLVLLVLLGALSLFAVSLVQQLSDVPAELPGMLQRATDATRRLPGAIQNAPLPDAVRAPLTQAYQGLNDQLGQLSRTLLDRLATYVTGGGLVATVTVVAGDVVRLLGLLALTLYLLLDFPRVSRSLVEAVPTPYQDLVTDLLDKFEHAVGGYFRGQLLIALIVGIVTGAGLALLRVPLALSLGFLAGVFNLVPYLGVIIAITPTLVLAAPQGWWTVIGVLVVFTIANQLEGHVLSPIILARSVRLHPATVIVAILLGLHLGGVLGALLAVPAAGFLTLLYREYYQKSAFYRDG